MLISFVKRFCLPMILLLMIAACAAPAATPAPKSEGDIEFVPGGGAFQSLDVYLPTDGDGPFTTILMIHGGAFMSRSKAIYRPLAEYLTERGYAVVSVNYRFSTKASYPAQVEDVFCALAWVHDHAEKYGFDTDRVFAWGGSSGGYLASMIGTVDDSSLYLRSCSYSLPADAWVQGVIVFYGFFDFVDVEGYPEYPEFRILSAFWGAPYEELPFEVIEQMSPQSWVDGSEAPFLLIHGTEDGQVPSWMSEQFAAVLEHAGVPVELVLIEGEGHAFQLDALDSPTMSQALSAVEAFLEANTQ